ncbi:MAG: hypothetical protein CXR31_11695 [Geobacter sp.]|nr:MAG: hypothetical protein CXR31_11695 [Geobacter sp.]
MNLSGDIVKKARVTCNLTQKEFAKILGRAQSEVSKYERNLVDPPGSLIIHCMNIIDGRVGLLTPSVDKIIEKLKDGFNSPKHAMARSLIMGIILNEEKKKSAEKVGAGCKTL